MNLKKSKSFEYAESLDKQKKKVEEKDLLKGKAKLPIISEQDMGSYYVVKGKNFFGRVIELRNKDRENCLIDLATLNGITITEKDKK